MKTPLHFNALHIYRSILRQITYHPDPQARSWLKQYAISSFWIAKDKSIHEFPSWPTPERASRETTLLKRARKFLSTVRSANNGSFEHFRRIIALAYGRHGPRRRELMHSIMARVDTPGDTQASSKSPPTKSPDVIKSSSASIASPNFIALSRAQARNGSYILEQTRTLRPQGPKDFPATTIWNRPTPPARLARHRQKWYAHDAAILLPPLPIKDWHYIRNIAVQNIALAFPPIRKAGTTGVLTHDDPDTAYSNPQQPAIDFFAPLKRSLDPPNDKSTLTQQPGPRQGPFTRPRWLSRQYAWLLRHTPLAVHKQSEELLLPGSSTPSSPESTFKAGLTAVEAANAADFQRMSAAALAGREKPPEAVGIDANVLSADSSASQGRSTVKEQGPVKESRKAPKQNGPEYLFDDAHQRTVLVRDKVRGERMQRLLFG